MGKKGDDQGIVPDFFRILMEILIGILVGKATDLSYLIIIKKYSGISKFINVDNFLCKSGFENIS